MHIGLHSLVPSQLSDEADFPAYSWGWRGSLWGEGQHMGPMCSPGISETSSCRWHHKNQQDDSILVGLCLAGPEALCAQAQTLGIDPPHGLRDPASLAPASPLVSMAPAPCGAKAQLRQSKPTGS